MAWSGEEREYIRAPNHVGRRGPFGLSTDLPFSLYSNTPTPPGGPHQHALAHTWMYAAMPGSRSNGWPVPPGPAPAAGQARQDDGERPSEDLRRTIDDVESGRIETADYPSAKEYLEHLYAVSDG